MISKRNYERNVINLRETPNQTQPAPRVEPTPEVNPTPAPAVEPAPTPESAPVEKFPEQLQVRLNSAYPAITSAVDDPATVRILKRLTAGRCGEFTAVNIYFYQYLILKNTYPEIAETLREISLVEMMHYEMLSEAVVDFGGDPTLTDGTGNVWTGRNINREHDVREILQDNIRAEQNGIRRLELAAASVQNVSLSQLFLRIIEDEKNHIIILNKLLETI